MAVSNRRLRTAPGPGRARGMALVTALLITTLAAVAAVAMASRQQLDIRRTANVLDGDQSFSYALGVESWARKILARDANDSETDHTGEAWAQQLPPISVPGGQIAGYVEDLQGRFNLNNLLLGEAISEADQQQFERLLGNLELDTGLALRVADWIDGDQETRFPEGAEDTEYLLQEMPYRSANRAMVSVSELRLLKGVTPEAAAVLLPHVTALPARTPVNVNTATIEVMRSLAEELTDTDAQRLIDDRGAEGYKSVAEFLQHELLAGLEIDESRLSTDSSFFLVHADVDIGTARTRMLSLLRRVAEGGPALVYRAQGEP